MSNGAMIDELLAAGWTRLIPEQRPRGRRIGAAKVAIVLMYYAIHADAELRHGPSLQTVANETGLYVADVRLALEALAATGLLQRDGNRGRAHVYRVDLDAIRARQRAGMPADKRAGMPARSEGVDSAGDRAGKRAGKYAGMPATEWSEVKNRPPTPHAERQPPPPPSADTNGGGANREGYPEHKHEPNARRALATLLAQHSELTRTTVDDLVPAAYRLGAGDPWAGYLNVKAELSDLGGARMPDAVLRMRLGIGRNPALATGAGHGADAARRAHKRIRAHA